MKWYRACYMNMDGEYEPTPTRKYDLEIIRKEHKLSFNHSYKGSIIECDDGKGWYAFLYLTIGNKYIQKILNEKVEGSYFKTLKEAKQFCNDWIHHFDKSYAVEIMLHNWMKQNIKPCFNEELEYVGDSYFGPTYIHNSYMNTWDRTVYDYFNENPVDYHNGRFYTLELANIDDIPQLRIFKNYICPGSIEGCWIHDENMENTLLEKTIQLRTDRFRRFEEYYLTKCNIS